MIPSLTRARSESMRPSESGSALPAGAPVLVEFENNTSVPPSNNRDRDQIEPLSAAIEPRRSTRKNDALFSDEHEACNPAATRLASRTSAWVGGLAMASAIPPPFARLSRAIWSDMGFRNACCALQRKGQAVGFRHDALLRAGAIEGLDWLAIRNVRFTSIRDVPPRATIVQIGRTPGLPGVPCRPASPPFGDVAKRPSIAAQSGEKGQRGAAKVVKRLPLHPPPTANPMQRAICFRTFAPALPEYPAASVRDYCAGKSRTTWAQMSRGASVAVA